MKYLIHGVINHDQLYLATVIIGVMCCIGILALIGAAIAILKSEHHKSRSE